MSEIAIRCEGLGKQYRIGQREGFKTLRDTIADTLYSPVNRLRSAFNKTGAREENGQEDSFWALKDVSFEIKRGEVVGIIGRNGAGKSTLLKILSRITQPTEGEVEMNGRVASLLEVGTGFHPELTGRENIFLNGAILGMKKAEIRRNFDEIVAFAEIEKFIDTPVKRYSSGMYVRLAFAVAAHLEPEILVVDEVLAVGDAAFQKKCLGKMQDVARHGRTVLFVSHNMGATKKLCSQSIWLEEGRIAEQGATLEIINKYLSVGLSNGLSAREWTSTEAPGNDLLKLRAVRVCQPTGNVTSSIDITKPFEIEMLTEIINPMSEVALSLKIQTSEGEVVLHTADIFNEELSPLRAGLRLNTCRLPAHAINKGTYILSVAADIPNVRIIFVEEGVLQWTVEPSCPLMARYSPETWVGLLGPRTAHWSKKAVIE